MSKFLYFIKRHNAIKDFIKLIIAYVYYPIVVFYWLITKIDTKYPKGLWLVGELGVDAKDNGFYFFKYLNKNHPEISSYYYIDYDQPISSVVKKVGKTVSFNGRDHKKAFINSKYIISTQDMYSIPFGRINWKEFKKAYPWLVRHKKYVFLQHGVIKDDSSENLNYKRTLFDYFVVTTKDEFNEINSDKYGYPKGNVIMTGLPRYDNLYIHRNDPTKKEILFMPTWRQYLADVTEKQFMVSEYFQTINDLLNDQKLIDLLDRNNLNLAFFPPHQEIQKFLHLFYSKSDKIRFIDVEEESVSQLILNSKVMITDYSSVAFDFAFLKKPVIYFQFDEKTYRKGHYKEGYFSYLNDGFGPVVYTKKALICAIEDICDDKFKVKNEYLNRINNTFNLRDNLNSSRLFNILNRG